MDKPDIVFQLPDTGEWAVGQIKTIHPTKGAADKANKKNLSGNNIEKHSTKNKIPDTVAVLYNNITYNIDLYTNNNDMCLALCLNPKYENIFGYDLDWGIAVKKCIEQIKILSL